jgi:KRAB domain-containing zinc finger protein
MKSVSRTAPFQCRKCPKRYRRKYGLKAHMHVSHDEVMRYQCYFCLFTCIRKSDMIQHMSKHTKEKPYKCENCCQSYRKEVSVKRHKYGESCRPRITYPLLSPCYFCGSVFSTNNISNVHMKSVHLKEGYKRCNLCDKYFSSTTTINLHIRRVHLLERKYKCQLCSKKLGTIAELNLHIQSVHTKEKPFKCYFCSKSFVSLGSLKRHTWIHTKEKALTCYFCRKDFSFLQDLSVHVGRFHTKERPYQCNQCPSCCYSSKYRLNAHVRKKHGTRVQQ